MRKPVLLMALALAGYGPAMAQYAPAPPKPQVRGQEHYTGCLALAGSNPAQAKRAAENWQKNGGAEAASHCLGVALLNLGQYKKAARLLTDTASKSQIKHPGLRANMFAQAANAWIIAGDDARAAGLLNQSIALAPKEPDYRIDRAIALASQGKDWEALDDLNEAITIAPGRVDALTFRASAWRRVGSMDLAAQDAEKALSLRPDYPEALLERGLIRAAAGDVTGARADWQHILRIAVEGPLTDAARRNLKRLDGR